MFIRRKRYLVKKKLQFKYLLLIFFAMLVPSLICGSALYYLIWQTVAAEMAIPEAIASALIPALYKVNMILAVILPLVFLVMLLFAIFISHRVAGPVYRLERELKEITQNRDYSHRIKLRSRDELQEIAEGINDLLENLKSQG